MNSRPQLDEKFMQEAIRQAQKAVISCGNNPPVGCVIVYQQDIIAKGYTHEGTHAEIQALNQLGGGGASLTQAEIFITLEPCCFHGRTPPCTEALIKVQPQRVIIAHRDPHPLVRGRGIATLRQAQIKVTEGILTPQVALIIKPWLARFPALVPQKTVRADLDR